MSAKEDLVINRALQNHKFNTWRLGRSFVRGVASQVLPGSVWISDSGDGVPSYVHTRAAVKHNHLMESGDGQLFALVTPEGRAGAVSILHLTQHTDPVQPLLVNMLAEVQTAQDPQLAADELALDATVVACPMPASHAEDGAGLNSHQHLQHWLLMSTGHGDVRLLCVRQGQLVWVTAPVYPLRPQTPLVGVRAVRLEALYCLPDGDLCCAMWAIRPRTPSAPATCEVFLVTLSCVPATPSSQPPIPAGDAPPLVAPTQEATPSLSVTQVQLVGRSAFPPHCALPCPSGQGVLLGLDTSTLDSDGTDALHGADQPPGMGDGSPGPMDGQQHGLAQGAGAGAGAAAAAGPQRVDDGPVDMHIDCRPGGADDSDDIDPRTLAAAAARLAHLTSEEVQGAQPSAQWTDIYKESGPEEHSQEPGCDLLVAVTPGSHPSWLAGPAACGAATPQLPTFRMVEQRGGAVGGAAGGAAPPGPASRSAALVSCGPHKLQVVAAENPGLLAVTDDVDVCVLQLGWQPASPQPAAGAAAQPDGAGAESAQAWQPWVQHVATVPALAYITAGKTQRKHLLLGDAGCRAAGICAALVEGSKFSYVYGMVDVGEQFGTQQVIDMQLEPGERILGARLVAGKHAVSNMQNVAQTQSARVALLILLTQQRVITHTLAAA